MTQMSSPSPSAGDVSYWSPTHAARAVTVVFSTPRCFDRIDCRDGLHHMFAARPPVLSCRI
jgi:hypothetical protein